MCILGALHMFFVHLAFCICNLCGFLNRMCDCTMISRTLSEITSDVWVISVSVLVYGAGTYYEYETKSEDMCGGSGYP